MIGAAQLLGALLKLTARPRLEAISACAQARTRRVFRFAYEGIHQDLIQESVSITVTVLHRRRIGIAGTDTLDLPSLRRCVQAAAGIAEHSPTQDQLPEWPRRGRVKMTADYQPATMRLSAAACVTSLKRLFQLCKGAGADLAGSFLTGDDELAVANSAGLSAYSALTVSGAKLVTMYGKLSGYASGVHRDVRRLDLDSLLTRSLGQSLHRTDPVTLPLGPYDVILEPEAVADLVGWLSFTAFGAKSVQERSSFLAGRADEPLMDPRVTIYDDGNDPEALRMPFDFEGVPKQRVVFIDRGRAKGPVYDSIYGARFGQASTGHAMPPGDTEGPIPLHLAIAPGQQTLAGMIKSCRRGLLIPRFHYVNGLLNPREALMTGLTREGVFLIERGKLTRPVTTMRFTQSLLSALRRVLGISRERRLIADPSQDLGCSLMPALHLAHFEFTGRQES